MRSMNHPTLPPTAFLPCFSHRTECVIIIWVLQNATSFSHSLVLFMIWISPSVGKLKLFYAFQSLFILPLRCFCSVWPCPRPLFLLTIAPTPGYSHHFWGYCSPHSIAGHFGLSSGFLKSYRKHGGNNHWGSHCCSLARASTMRSFT